MTVNNRNCVRVAQGSDPFAKETSYEKSTLN